MRELNPTGVGEPWPELEARFVAASEMCYTVLMLLPACHAALPTLGIAVPSGSIYDLN